MEQGQIEQIEALLGCLSVGIAVLDSTNLRIRYLNSYLRTRIEDNWDLENGAGRRIEELLPEEVRENVLACLRHVATTGESIHYAELPYEGFLQTRGRTYWRVTIKKALEHEILGFPNTLLVTIEDMTETVRSRLHLKAIHYISSAIVGAYALPLVLDRILHSACEMIGSTKCAVLLIEHSISGDDVAQHTIPDTKRRATIAAQKGVHVSSQEWRPIISKRLLLGRVERERHTLAITDTTTFSELDLPFLDDHGTPRPPGSVLCIPIFEPHILRDGSPTMHAASKERVNEKAVLGSIEIYHRRARGFATEEVELLEQFAQQAGLAIQHARLLRNIDQRARAERRSAHQRAYVMQAIPDGVIIFDPRWRIAETNQAIRTLLGWSNSIVGQTVTQALRQSNAIFYSNITHLTDPIPELERRAYAGLIDEFKMIGADGQVYAIRCTYTPICDDVGDTFAFVVIYHDVTEQAEARERIEAKVIERTKELAQRNEALQLAQIAQEMEHARLELLLERLPSGIILVSAVDNSITIINRRAVQLLQRMGVALEPSDNPDQAAIQAVGVDSEHLFRPISTYGASGSFIHYEERPLSLALRDGKANEAELHMQGIDGQTIYIFASAAPLRAANGTITSAVLVYNEITTIKALERAREDFFTTMAHELKTPLANIRAHLSALLAKDLQWSIEEQHASLLAADEQVERLVSMVNQVLNASRVEAGALRLKLEAVLLPELFEDLEERLAALIASSQRHLRVEYPNILPPVRADYELIMSVLVNLLSNAFRYAPEGDTVLLEAKPIFDPQDSHPIGVTLCVSDRGQGIPQEQQKILFTRFSTFAAMSRSESDHPEQPDRERRPRTVRWSPTTGLGLYISRGIIEAHASKLTFTSSPGQGASFAFTLSSFKDI
ncbi:MAG: hypothetical protein NVS4B11_06700 [Ktedonobacteraceae bacterium]